MRPIVASDLMNPEVLSVAADLTVEALARFLVENDISGAPVLGQDGDLVGVVSLVDVSVATTDTQGRAARAGFLSHGQGGPTEALSPRDPRLRVRDIMTPEVSVVSDDATVSEIASVMLDEHLHRVLVTRDGRVVGIISTSDLLGLLVHTNDRR